MPQRDSVRSTLWRRLLLVTFAVLGGLASCVIQVEPQPEPDPIFNNTTDLTNLGADYIGSAACLACHSDLAAVTELTAHRHALTPIRGTAPRFPAAATRAVIPNPPDGFAWTDISYVLAGYLHGALFIDANGFFLTDGTAGVNTQWNLAFGANGTDPGFVAYQPAQVDPLPFDYDCFRCHTTGPQPQTAENPGSQDGRPGIGGTWSEPGVRCEACHGPGSNHAPFADRRNIFVGGSDLMCTPCHSRGDDPNAIPSADGFMRGCTQSQQLRASGGHSDFDCTFCHDPHASSTYDPANGIRNDCTVCHVDQNLAFHDGITFTWGDYTEAVTCESCHMPPAGLSASTADPAVVGPAARIGDVRAHIFRINTEQPDASAFFTADGTDVQRDAEGRAAVTLDFVCLRCHNDAGAVFPLTLPGALTIAREMHSKAADAAQRPIIQDDGTVTWK